MTGHTALFPLGHTHPEPEPNLRDLQRLMFKHGLLVLACTAAATVMALAVYQLQQPVFTSSARIWVKTELGSPSFLSGVTAYREALYPDPVNRRIETEMELMLTRTSAASVLKELKVQPEQLPGSTLGPVLKSLGLGGPSDPSTSTDALIDPFLKSVTVEPLRSKAADTTSNILELKFSSTDPELAPKALGRLLGNYLNVAASQNRRLGEEASRLLTTEVAQARQELLELDAQILSQAARGPSSRSADRAERSADSASGASSKRSSSREGRESRARRDSTFSGAPAGNAQALASLKTQTVEMQAELDALRELYTDEAENVKALSRRLAAMQRRLAEGLTASVQAETSLSTLERQRLLAQERYNEVQKKLDQIKLYLRLDPSDAESRVIVDQPSRPQAKEGKRKPLIVLAGPVAGLLLGLLIAGLRELFDQRLQSRRDVMTRLGLPVLGALPRLSSSERQRLAGLPR